MTTIKAIELTPIEAAARVHQELSCAGERLQTGDLGPALDAYSWALTEKVLLATLDAACGLACSLDTEGLSALGPVLVNLVTQVRDAGVLPCTAVMDAWASVATDLGALIGQVGLALAIHPDHRLGMMDNAHIRAALLDDATGGLFNLANWMDQIDPTR
jgi:hypothetical protein